MSAKKGGRVTPPPVHMYTCEKCDKTIASLYDIQFETNKRQHKLKHDVEDYAKHKRDAVRQHVA